MAPTTLKERLSRTGMNQKELAKKLGFSQQMVSFIVTGRRKVPLSKIKLFEKVTGIPREQFRPELYR